MKDMMDDTKIQTSANQNKILPNLTLKRRKWLDLYLNYDNSITFGNAMECTRRAYNPKTNDSCRAMSHQIFEILSPYIEKWLNELAFTDETVKMKIYSLMNAKQTKFFAFKGQIRDMIEVEALDIQAKATDIACKVKGLYKDVQSIIRPVFNIDFGTGAEPEGPSFEVKPEE